MSLQIYGLDQIAQQLVLTCRSTSNTQTQTPDFRSQDILGQVYKMRTTVAYGLERFWGEHLRLGADTPEGRYWKDVWDALVEDVLKSAKIDLPNSHVVIKPPPKGRKELEEEKKRREVENSRQVHSMADQLWQFSRENPNDQRVALSVLTQLCDCMVWWTQRIKE